MLAIAAGVAFALVMGMTILTGKRAASLEDAIKGTEALTLPQKVDYRRTLVALIPSSIFIIGVMVLTLWAFGHLWDLPIRFQTR